MLTALILAVVLSSAPQHAPVAFTLPEAGLVAEGIAVDPRDGALLVGSIHQRKILRVDPRTGQVSELVAPTAGGLGRVLGVKVDARRGLLWAASILRASPGGGAARAALHAFDLATGAPAVQVALDGPGHLLNDLAIAEDGTVFATDSEAGAVFRLDPGAAALTPVVAPGRLDGPNGIVLAEGHLLVADDRGLWACPPRGGEPSALPAPAGLALGGIDGLSAEGRTLVAIQNGVGSPRILRLELAPGAARVERAAVLEEGNPAWHLPTTGALHGGALFYIGNSHVDAWGRDGVLAPAGLVPTRIHRLPIR